MQRDPGFRLPPLLSARLQAWWLLHRVRRSPSRALAVLAVVVMAAGLVVVAVHGPVQGCAWRGVAVPGERAHWVCERVA